MLIFKPSTHQYFVSENEYVSVTRLLERYKNTFDTDFWSTYKALEKLIGEEDFATMKKHKYFKSPAFIEWACSFVDYDELLVEIQWFKDKWDHERDEGLRRGTLYHNIKEKQAYDKGFDINPFTKKEISTMMKKPPTGDKSSLSSNLYDLEDGYYPELMIWNEDYRIAGTADKVFIKTLGKRRYVDIDDYKTGKEIKKSNPYQKMRPPLDRYDDCNHSHYRIQIGMYAWMMEQFGYHIRYTSFSHYNSQYKFSYGHLRKSVKAMLDHYASGSK